LPARCSIGLLTTWRRAADFFWLHRNLSTSKQKKYA